MRKSREGSPRLRELNRDEQLLLLRVVCSFAWVDGVVHPSERDFVSRLMKRWQLDAAGARQVKSWLAKPPAPDTVDPQLVPAAHRTRFLHAIETVIAIDGEVSPIEKERLFSFARLLR